VALGPLGREQRTDDPTAHRERDPEQPAQPFRGRRVVGVRLVDDPFLADVVRRPHRRGGRRHPADQPRIGRQPHADQLGRALPAGHDDPQRVPLEQGEVRQVDPEEPAGLVDHALEQVGGLVDGSELLRDVVERGELDDPPAPLLEQRRNGYRGPLLAGDPPGRLPGLEQPLTVGVQVGGGRLGGHQLDPAPGTGHGAHSRSEWTESPSGRLTVEVSSVVRGSPPTLPFST
jgi:hypothetical protein